MRMQMPNETGMVSDNTAAHRGARAIRSREDLASAIAAVATGDTAAFALVYTATAAKLFGIIVRIVRRPEVAEEVLQEVYLRVWQHANAFDGRRGSPITWLATIARHRALDEVRCKNAMLAMDECPEALDLASADDLRGEDDDMLTRDLGAALERLSGEKRSILLLAYCYGLTREEIATRAGRPIPTIKTWLRRSLAELKGYLVDNETGRRAIDRGSCVRPANPSEARLLQVDFIPRC